MTDRHQSVGDIGGLHEFQEYWDDLEKAGRRPIICSGLHF